MEQPLVSVIIPAYNAGKWISSAIENIQQQTYRNWELIIVNDGSTDMTPEVCQKYAITDDRIHLYTQKNQGPSAARNNGLSHMEGDYFTIIDSDDLLHKEALEIYVAAAEKNNAEVVVAGYRMINSFTNETCEYTFKSEMLFQVKKGNINIEPVEKVIQAGLMASNWNKLYKKELSDLRFDENLSLNEDVLFSLTALSRAKSVVVIPDVLYDYRIQNGQSLSLKFHPELPEALEALENQLVKNQSLPLRLGISRWLSNYMYVYMKNICINSELKGRTRQLLGNCVKSRFFRKYMTFSNADTMNRKIGSLLLRLKMPGMYIFLMQIKKRG